MDVAAGRKTNRPPRARRAWPWLALWAGAALGCARLETAGHTPLSPARMFSDSVALEIVFVRFPLGQEDLNDELWRTVDEQAIDLATRRRLDAQGFRVGLLSGYVPEALARQLADAGPPSAAATATGPPGAATESAADFVQESAVSLRHVQTHRGQRIDIVASSVYARLPVLEFAPNGSLRGRDFEQAECHFSLRASPESDGGVRVELLPEVHHGPMRPRLTPKPEMGLVVFETSRQRQAYDPLRVRADLAPGELLVLGTRTDRPGSLAAGFFTVADESQQPRDQKLLLVRLAQTQHDSAFSTAEELLLPDMSDSSGATDLPPAEAQPAGTSAGGEAPPAGAGEAEVPTEGARP